MQVEIESLEGQRRVLEDQSGFGTLAVTVARARCPRPSTVVAADDDDGGLGGAWDEAERGFGDAIEWLVARSGKAVVLAAVALALYAIGVFAWRRRPPRRKSSSCSAQPLAWSASMSLGSTLWTSPTIPRSAMPKIGASGSLLMAMMFLLPFMPTMCCVAPEMPAAM